uniref:Uncharacterized protein n=1 Tax=Tanacetum cinerariifolium TaxID=118510 RepID=A0A6L2JWU2_TANCI|nr:hypothetical protein [Tanacetum cinerariifolium]
MFSESSSSSPSESEEIDSAQTEAEKIVGSVLEPNSLSEDLNIKSPKSKQAENTSAPALQKFYLSQMHTEEKEDKRTIVGAWFFVKLSRETLTFVKLLREDLPFSFFIYKMYCGVMNSLSEDACGSYYESLFVIQSWLLFCQQPAMGGNGITTSSIDLSFLGGGSVPVSISIKLSISISSSSKEMVFVKLGEGSERVSDSGVRVRERRQLWWWAQNLEVKHPISYNHLSMVIRVLREVSLATFLLQGTTDSCWSSDLKSKATEDIISIESFMEVLVLNHYVFVRKILYYKDDSYWSAALKSKATEDIISIGSFLEVLALNYYVLVRKIIIMDPTSSLGRICLGENVYGSTSEKVEGHGNWDAIEYTDTAVKLCLDYEVKKGNKIVKKELIVALKREFYFVKFIINPKEDDVEPGVILGRSFMRLVNVIVDFGIGVITVYPEQDPFEDDFEKTEKSKDDWDQLLDFNFDDIPQLDGEELPPFVCKMGKSSRNKKRAMENLNLFYQDIGISSSTGRHLTQKEAEKEALAHRTGQKFALLEEVRLLLETMAYNDKYKKVLDEIWKDKVMIRGIVNTPEILFSTFDGICHQTFRAARSDVLRTAESDSNDEEEYEIKRKKFGAPMYGLKLAAYLNCNDPANRSLALQSVINPFRKISVSKKAVSFLGSLTVPLQHVDWKPDYNGCYTNEEEAKGQWRTKIRLTDPYGNIYVHAFTTKKTSRKLSKYYKLSDIMSPNWFIE